MDCPKQNRFPQQQISSSLKERLKRSSIYALSPISTKRSRKEVTSAEKNICIKFSPTKNRENEAPDIKQETQLKNLSKFAAPFAQAAESTSTLVSSISNRSSHIQGSYLLSPEGTKNCQTPKEEWKEAIVKTPNLKSPYDSRINVKNTGSTECSATPSSINRYRLSARKTANSVNVKRPFTSPVIKKDNISRGIELSSNIASFGCLQEKTTLKLELANKEETLRKLQMAKIYRAKNNLSELQSLINKWRSACQQALEHLHSLTVKQNPSFPPSMAQLLANLQVDPVLVKYNVEEESFEYT